VFIPAFLVALSCGSSLLATEKESDHLKWEKFRVGADQLLTYKDLPFRHVD